jgi:hypothetical protein
MGKRTRIDYSNHLLHIVENEHVNIHHLRLADTGMHSVKFINCGGIMAVTGDFGNWIFCREFVPSSKGYACEGYWQEKLHISSTQKPEEVDFDRIKVSVKNRLEERMKEIEYEGDHPLEDHYFDHDDSELMFWKKLYDAAEEGDELGYQVAAFRSNSDFAPDYESIPYHKKSPFWLLAVMDAFDEICDRYKKEFVTTV